MLHQRRHCRDRTCLTGLCLVVLVAVSAAAANPGPRRLFVIGDSTAASYPEVRAPLTGWAQVLQEYFVPERLIVENKARGGRSSKSYYEEGAWQPIQENLRPGDFVFIQFGHNDAHTSDPNRFTDPQSTYKEFLRRYVNETRAAGAVPVLLTPINRNGWLASGEFTDSMGGYPQAVRQVARELHATMLDLHRLTRDRFESLGPADTKALFLYLEPGTSPNYPEGKQDGTHLCEDGAREVSGLAVHAIRALNHPLGALLK